MSAAEMQQRAEEFRKEYARLQAEIGKVIVGHSEIVHGVLTCLFVGMATQNPIEQEGTYPLPEAQLDRFFFKLMVNYSGREEMATILDRTTRGEWPKAERVMDGERIRHWQQLVREVLVAPPVQDYAIRLVLATHPQGEFATADTNRYLRVGASPRGAQALVLAGKVRALLEGRYNVSFEDIRRAYLPALRHRVLLNFEAQAENMASDTVLAHILNEVNEKGPEGSVAVRGGKSP